MAETLTIIEKAELKKCIDNAGDAVTCWELEYRIGNSEIADLAYYGMSVSRADYPTKDEALASNRETARVNLLAAVNAVFEGEYE